MKRHWAVATVLLGSGYLTAARGLIISPVPHTTFCSGQAAIIHYGAGREELHVLYKGSLNPYRSSLWLIPVPAEPTIGDFQIPVLDQLSRLSAPVRHGVVRSRGCYGYVTTGFSEANDGYDLDKVELLEANIAGVNAVSVIHTDNVDSLSQWVRDRHYIWLSGYEDAIDYYLRQGWTWFVAVKTDSGHPYEGCAVSLSFNSAEPVLPLEILKEDPFSSKNYDQKFAVYVTIVADEKKSGEGFDLRYANRLDDDEWKAAATDMPGLQGLLKSGDYVTKLSQRYGKAGEIRGDLVLKKAPDTKEYRSIISEEIYQYYNEAGNCLLWLIACYPCYLVGRKIVRRARHRRSSGTQAE
jgi:hypothetical protein